METAIGERVSFLSHTCLWLTHVSTRSWVGTKKVSLRSPGQFLTHQQKLVDQDIGPQNINKKSVNLRLIRPDYLWHTSENQLYNHFQLYVIFINFGFWKLNLSTIGFIWVFYFSLRDGKTFQSLEGIEKLYATCKTFEIVSSHLLKVFDLLLDFAKKANALPA